MLWSVPAAAADLPDAPLRATAGAGAMLTVDQNERGAPLVERTLLHYAKVSSVLEADAIVGAALGPARLGVVVPLDLDPTGALALGDAGLDARLVLTDPLRRPLGLGLGARLSLPATEVTAVVDAAPGPARLAVNVGARTDGRAVARLGVGYALDDDAGLTFESAWTVRPTPSAQGSTPLRTGAPVGEALLGAWSAATPAAAVRIAGGAGLTSGTADLRVLVGLDLRPVPSPRAPVAIVAPPPPPDADGDGILDADDLCPARAEDRDRVRDDDGCPEPEVPVRVHLVDRDGAPAALASAEVDGRGSGPGADLYLELLPGPHAITAAGQGYDPVHQDLVVGDAGLQVDVVLPPERIQLDRTVHFGTDSASIPLDARRALDDIAAILRDHPEIEVLRIEGHSDPRGDALQNLHLSERRAAVVAAYLAAQGVDPARLVTQGYGESRLADPRPTPEGWAANRRVELIVP
jgi:outer membrane protein OmpA-like peptidoglycan-associated protein